ncbi:cobalt ABC transporter permease [Tropicimonas isoalkanivorans]|uniref:Nickel transport protein n=1 Tax=Tropicimonas isoalkanivorans TaxID=441112 RepID=A0A1I1LDS6_9RHOB|nr:cobalt ABC transporter permease [Tropicimonas isoalkanivorans]SFC71106.1 nickel transport protein [Tropicimonas isoalkanivorans]
MIRAFVLAVSLALFPVPGLAHKVVISVFPSGSQIEGEVGFTNGGAGAGTLVEVFDGDGGKLGETVTDDDGFFLYTPTAPVAHVFRADLGAGHVAKTEMSAADVAAIVGKAPASQGSAQAAAATPGAAATIAYAAGPATSVAPGVDADEIARIVRDEMRPLRQEIAAYKEKNDLQNILGGIGYILGLSGVAFYLAARRKLQAAA